MPEPIAEEDYSGTVQIRCDYETYLAWWTLSQNYYNYEDALRDLLRVADEKPSFTRAGKVDLDLGDTPKPPTWG